MKIEIRATYAATDGRMPEDITIEIEDEAVPVDQQLIATVTPLVERLLVAPSARQLTEAWDGAKETIGRAVGTVKEGEPVTFLPNGLVRPFTVVTGGGGGSVPAGGKGGSGVATVVSQSTSQNVCRRQLCGHVRGAHSSVDDQGQLVGYGQGACNECGNADKCRSFVGSAADAPTPAATWVAGTDARSGDRLAYSTSPHHPNVIYVGRTEGQPAGFAAEDFTQGVRLSRDIESSTWSIDRKVPQP